MKRNSTKKPAAAAEAPDAEAPDPIDPAIAKLKLGRPPALTADPETCTTIRRLAEIQCTHAEAASVLGVHRVTFTRWLASADKAREAWDSGQEQGRMSLRRKQFSTALNGNVVMMIWCGKQYLGQRDQVTQEVKVEGANSKEELRTLLDAMAKRAP